MLMLNENWLDILMNLEENLFSDFLFKNVTFTEKLDLKLINRPALPDNKRN